MNRCPKCGTQFEGTGTGGPVACPLCDTYSPNEVSLRRRIAELEALYEQLRVVTLERDDLRRKLASAQAELDELRTIDRRMVDEVKRLRAELADAIARAEDAEADFSRLKAEMQARGAAEAAKEGGA